MSFPNRLIRFPCEPPDNAAVREPGGVRSTRPPPILRVWVTTKREERRRRFVGSPLQLVLLVGCVVAFVLPVGGPLLQVIAGVAMFGLVLIPAAYGVMKAFDVQDPSQQ